VLKSGAMSILQALADLGIISIRKEIIRCGVPVPVGEESRWSRRINDLYYGNNFLDHGKKARLLFPLAVESSSAIGTCP